MDSTKPASRSTRRCLDTIGCGMPSCRSISPTDCCDETSRLNIARRFGSAMISNTDSMLLVYSTEHIRVKAYVSGVTRQARRSTRFRAILQKYGVLVGGVWVIGGNHYRLEPRFHRAGLLGRVRWGIQISSGFLPWR